jgi:antitoxin ParD1/3/4
MPSSYTIGNHYEQFVKQLLQSGRYATASEIMRDGLRLLQEREMEQRAKLDGLRMAVRDGEMSGTAIAAEVVFDRLSKKYTRSGDKK